MSRLYSLSYMTLETSPPNMIAFAAEAGYDLAGIRMLPSLPGGRAFPLMHDPAMLRETLMRIDDTGVKVLDVEIARMDGMSGIELWLPMLEASARIGAQTIVVAGDDPDEARMTETYGLLCDAAAPFGLTVNLEFTPWTVLNNAAMASRIVAQAARANGEILIDLIHVARSTTTLADIGAIDPACMRYFQICDAPAGIPTSREELLFTARQERLLPGEGGVDLDGIVGALPDHLIVSVEIPSHSRLAAMGPAVWSRQTLAACRASMKALDGKNMSKAEQAAG
ncbi:MAG: sugar phosphate isomerase/epimerase family protein [Alphaproteobacteria bacterium]